LRTHAYPDQCYFSAILFNANVMFSFFKKAKKWPPTASSHFMRKYKLDTEYDAQITI